MQKKTATKCFDVYKIYYGHSFSFVYFLHNLRIHIFNLSDILNSIKKKEKFNYMVFAVLFVVNMLNKKVIKSIKGSFTMDKKEEYSFETRMQTLVTKKSLRYSPFISVKTPAKLLMGLGGSVEIKYKKAAKVDLTVTGLTRSPMKYFGK